MMLNDDAFSPNLPARLDSLISDSTIEPMIVVLPDCFTRFGGSQYINSAATGNYEDYLVDELVPFVDKNFRTINHRDSRAIMGKSSGGYGSLIMGMRHADTFGLICSIAGDCYFDLCYRSDFVKAFRGINGNPNALLERIFDETAPKGKFDFDGLNVIGMSACYSPNLSSEYGFDLPFDLETCELREDVWARWLEHDPINLVENNLDSLKSLQLLFLDAGKSDEFGLDLGAKILANRFRKNDVRFLHEEFNGGHFKINFRLNRSLELISQNAIHDL